MALPWPHSTPTLPRPVPAVSQAAPARPSGAEASLTTRVITAARSNPTLVRLGAGATSPVTALVVMLLGLALLFVLPMVGLPFVALVVLPAVVHQLRPENRALLRRRRV
ncbi:hypothetical protein [Actinomycetospora cinnamomea]|uniref:Uncharacterized protein n=1 Tax=Actinomycetospora cinnamomea TaxID=663609 RepID=A0A2U1FA06_9PSEU|nr:hypothetical protein [Actinomycetospora cinnamomea]PVZ09008.1 hypothetical protein C8D89_107170 [Actinomycetospora cinnamomea]